VKRRNSGQDGPDVSVLVALLAWTVALAPLAHVSAAGPSDDSAGKEIQLVWEAPPDCADDQEVRQAVDRYLGRQEYSDLGEVVVHGTVVTTQPSGFRLHIEVNTPVGQTARSVDSETCQALTRAAGLVIAIALDPLKVVDEVERVRAVAEARQLPEPEPPSEPEPSSEPEPPLPPPAPQKSTLRLGLRASGGIESGALPKVGAGVALAAAMIWPRWRLELQGIYVTPREHTPYDETPGAGARLQLGAAAAAGCHVLARDRLEVPLCLGFEGGAMRADGVGLGDPKTSHRLWLAAFVAPKLAFVPHPRVALVAEVASVLTIVRPRFKIDDLGPLYSAGFVSVRALAGVEVRFP